MNRHQRRAQKATSRGQIAPTKSVMTAIETLNGLQEFSDIASRLQPYLAEIESLGARLDEAKAQLANMGEALAHQRAVFLRMLAMGMNLSVEDVIKLETSITEQMTGGDNANETTEPTDDTSQADHSSAGA